MSEIKKLGVDVSYAQSNIDWKAFKKQGVEFAIIRGGFGRSASQKDTMFESHIQGALASGLDVGIYWFGYAYTVEGAKAEADVCHEVIKAYKDKLTLPVFYDWEYDSMRYAKDMGVVPSGTLITDMTIAFMERMKELGYKTGFYTNYDFMENQYTYKYLENYDLWFAYYSKNKPEYDCVVQQYTSTGRLNGYGGNLDLNWLYKDYAEDKKPEPKPTEPAQTDIVYTVKAGDTLSGVAAKYGTTWQVLAAYNGIEDPNLILVGQKIKIPGGKVKPTEEKKETVYTVKAGDTLSGIAAKYGTDYMTLARINGIENPDLIFAGQRIKIQ